MLQIFKVFILSIVMSLLSSCCFHLRGENALPCPLRTIYIKSSNPYGEFEHKLRKAFLASHICVVPCSNHALFSLDINHTTLSYIPSSVGTSSQATVYKVTYAVEISLTDCRGKILMLPQTVKSSSTMIVNAQQALNSTNQIDVLSDQLQRETILKIFDILTSPRVCEIAYSHENHVRSTR